VSVLVGGCQNPPAGAFFYGSFKLGEPRILITNIVAGNQAISYYDQTGTLLGIVKDYTFDNNSPRGIVSVSPLDFIVAIDGVDQLVRYSLVGETKYTVTNANLSGNIYQIEKIGTDVFVIETNTIESFSVSDGTRIGNPRINTATGACTLNTPRGLAVNSAGHLVVTNTGGTDPIFIYDISNISAATCLVSNTSIGAQDPVAVLAHSDGYLYIATQADDAIWKMNGDGSGNATKIYQPGLAILNNPTALLEMPDGTILVASDGTNNILKIDTAGTLISNPFIQTSLTGQVGQMILMGGN
jgi:hypothetical protein